MITREEQTFIKKFVIKNKQERYLTFLSKISTRGKFTAELHHFRDFNWKLFREIPGSDNESQAIASKVKNNKNILICTVISANADHDGKAISVEDAIKNVVGTEGTILIFGDAEIVYYEGEAPKRRYISI